VTKLRVRNVDTLIAFTDLTMQINRVGMYISDADKDLIASRAVDLFNAIVKDGEADVIQRENLARLSNAVEVCNIEIKTLRGQINSD